MSLLNPRAILAHHYRRSPQSCAQKSARRRRRISIARRFLWCEAAVHAIRRDATLGRFYRRKLQQKGLGKARVAVARKLGIRLWILLRDQIDYDEFCRRAASPATAR